jgi:hypothetical protein
MIGLLMLILINISFNTINNFSLIILIDSETVESAVLKMILWAPKHGGSGWRLEIST